MWIPLLGMSFCPSPFMSPTFCLVPSYSSFLGSSSLSRPGLLLPFHTSAGSAFPYELPHVICAGLVVVAWCLMFIFPFLSSFQPLTMSIGGTIPILLATLKTYYQTYSSPAIRTCWKKLWVPWFFRASSQISPVPHWLLGKKWAAGNSARCFHL